MKKLTDRYGPKVISVLESLSGWAWLLGAHSLAWIRWQWWDRERLSKRGGRWVRRHKVATCVVLAIIALALLLARIDWPDEVFSWTLWTKSTDDVRNLLLVTLGVVAAAVGLVLSTIRTHAARLQARVAEQGHITDRFTKAIEQLGSDKLAVRLGAIYALERIAWDSRRDHGSIMETLTAYVRENAPRPPTKGDPGDKPATDEDRALTKRPPPTDIQAVLTILGRRNRRHDSEGARLDLTRTKLLLANLIGAHLEGANLRGAHLEGADLWGAQGLTQEQVDSAHTNGETKFPVGITIPVTDTAAKSDI